MKFAYLAGYVDGDGSIFAKRYTQKKGTKVFSCHLEISSTFQPICEYFFHEFGGGFSKKPEQRKNRKPSWVWRTSSSQRLSHIFKEIEPYLILKKKSAQLSLSLIETIINSTPHVGNPVTKETLNYRDELIKRIKEEIHMNDRVNEQLFESLKELKKCKTPSQADLAYLSGLIDAEGCFRIQHWKPKRKGRNETWVITLEIGNAKFPIFPWLIERFGGSIVFRKPSKPTQSPMIIWSLRSDSLFQVLPLIFPYLRVKKERCEKIGEFHQTGLMVGGDRHSSVFKDRIIDVLTTRRKLFEEFQILNRKGNH